MRNKEKVTLIIQEEGASVEQGQALITSRELEGAYDAEATYSVEFQGTYRGYYTRSSLNNINGRGFNGCAF